MKITIDLGEFFDQEPEVVGAEVLTRLTELVAERSISPDTHYEAGQIVQKVITEQVREGIFTAISKVVTTSLDDEYTPVTSYGAKSEPTTLRKEIGKHVAAALDAITGGNRSGYPSDTQKRWRDMIDAHIREVVGAEVKPFVAELRAKYNEGLMAALEKAVTSVAAARR